MAIQTLVFKNFEGGWSTDAKYGLKNSFAYSQSLDFRKKPSQITHLPQPTREDGGVVNDLIQNEIMVGDGTIYALGSSGGFYKRTTGGVWSREANLSQGCYGLDYRPDIDAVYAASNKYISWYQNVLSVNGTTDMLANYYGPSYSTYNNTINAGFNVAAYTAGPAGQAYTLTTNIIEDQQHRRYFQSDIEPLTKISVFVVSKGTGDWTLTLHDGLDNILGTKTVTNANLTNGLFNDFSFTGATNGQVRIYPAPNARTYHIHVTSTVADGTLSTTTASDFSTASLEVWADRLVQTNNGMHPIARFQQFECIGNGNYLSVWEPISEPPTNAEWERHKITFPQQYEVCGLAVMNEFIAIACEQTSTNNISKDGIIFFWDGLADTYNYFVRIPEGAPYGIHEYENVIYYYAGGAWYAIASPTTRPIKIRTMPGSDTEFSGSNSPIKIYPYATTVRRGIHLMAYPSMTTNTSINYGIYSYGAVDKNFPQSFGLNYLISTGSLNYSAQNNLQIGMVKAFGDLLHISWRDDSNGGYGVDVIDNTSNPASTGVWQSLIFDNGIPYKIKKALAMRVSFLPLAAGATVQPQYSINRGAWTGSEIFSSTNLYRQYTNRARIEIPAGDFQEIQLQLLTSATTQTPVITSVEFIFNDNREEEPS